MAKYTILELFKEIFLKKTAGEIVRTNCDKEHYSTQKKANDAVRGIGKAKNKSMASYKCNDCGNWHLTSIRKKNLNPTSAKKLKYPFRYIRK